MKYTGLKAWEYENECAAEAIAFLKENYNENWSEELLCLWKKPGEKFFSERQEEDYRRHLGAFHLLFSEHNERFDVFLKGCLFADDGGSPHRRFTKEDFTKEEWKMVKTAQDFCIRQTKLRPYGACYSFPNVNEPILTKRLTLRPPTIEDFREIRRHFQTDKEGRIAYCGLEEMYYPKDCFDFVIERNADKKLLGFVRTGRTNDLKYFVFKEYRSNGYATEAVKAFCSAAFSGKLLFPASTLDRTVFVKGRQAEFSAIKLTVLAGNEAAAKVAEKSGFVLEGLYEKGAFSPFFVEVDTLHYHLLKETENG